MGCKYSFFPVSWCGCPCLRAALAQAIPHLQGPTTSGFHGNSIPWGHSKPSRTVTAQSQGKENSTRICSKSLEGLCTRKGVQVFTSTHTHTAGHGWCSCTAPDKEQETSSDSLPTLLRGEQRVCVKETLLSKVIYEDRFFCIRDQSSESRDQLRHPSAAQGGKKHPPKPTKKTLSSFERGCEKQEGGEHSKSKSASKKSSRIRSFPV